MNKHMLPIACLIALLPLTQSQANNDPEYLAHSCRELVGIYAKRNEKRLAAGITTSVSEALRAGYCMGVVEEYRRHFQCRTGDWFRQAQGIAELPLSVATRSTVQELLEISCEI
ncbi:hypothetical protein D7243_20560 [Stutzerimonas stutzeri]|nr:hypothetical protein [Stutzerimonas stutzeri]